MFSRHDRVDLLDRYLRIPTVSRHVTPELLADVRAFWHDVGLEFEALGLEEREATPALYAEIAGPPNAPTLLLYGHYDVQPTGDLTRWTWEGVACPPFAPTYFDGQAPVDPRSMDDAGLARLLVVARGGADNKGQHLANVLGALDAARDGTLAWTVKIILDGEEEHGSPHLAAIARAHRARLGAHVLVGSDGPRQKNAPTLVMGVRGLLGVTLTADNGQPASVHSGNYGNIVPNPVLPLARLIEDLERHVRALATERATFRDEATKAFTKWKDAAVWSPYLWPTVNVNHFATDGTSAEQRRTIIPATARARLDIRLTPDTPLEAVETIVRETVTDHEGRTAGISFTVSVSGQPASYTSPARPEFEWLLRLLGEEPDTEPVALPILGGTLPAWVFTDLLGIPSFWLPSAQSDNRQHDVNEHYRLGRFFGQTDLYRRIASTRPA
jgi:acetylornithine deacetylase/succinyl-diaminopimelate desuccinylase-like protein